MSDGAANFMLFLGHFHPLLVHLPIGGLVLLGVLELAAWTTRWKDAARNSGWILGFVLCSAVASAACGWMLSQPGAYDAQLLQWHRALGLALTVMFAVALCFRLRNQTRAYRSSLALALLLLVAVGHLGGSITHGRDFLTRYAPFGLRTAAASAAAGGQAPLGVLSNGQPLFTGVIQPILKEHCVSCHGPDKHKGDLRLDTLDGLVRGGQAGPVLQGKALAEALLIQRVRLPFGADGHMPPGDESPLSAAELTLLESWVKAGAPLAATATDLKAGPEGRRLLQGVSTGAITR